MKRINLEQGSPAWLKWRKSVITGTDCPAILGSSPWQTPYKCWQRKLGLVEEQASNPAMERGKKLEPEARALFIEETGINMTPIVIESTEVTILGASLDGISDCGTMLLEVKCGGADLHNQAEHGIIPDYYMDQMQHQLLVTGASVCFYYSFNGKEGVTIKVLRDETFADRWLPKAREFWKGVAFFEPPALSQKDYRNMTDDLSWSEYAKMYVEVDAQIKAHEDKKDYLRKKLIELCDGQSSQGAGLRVMNIMSKGRIAYDEIPEIKSVNLERYRKEATNIWKFHIEKK
jgi:putative phage-type endonuclease